jgi:serine/threonine protein kinase
MKDLKLTLGTWLLDEHAILGKPGGFGTVYRGKSVEGKPVAIKLIRPDVGDAAHRELEFAQAFAGRQTQHVIPILDAGIDPASKQSCIVMMLAAGSRARVP